MAASLTGTAQAPNRRTQGGLCFVTLSVSSIVFGGTDGTRPGDQRCDRHNIQQMQPARRTGVAGWLPSFAVRPHTTAAYANLPYGTVTQVNSTLMVGTMRPLVHRSQRTVTFIELPTRQSCPNDAPLRVLQSATVPKQRTAASKRSQPWGLLYQTTTQRGRYVPSGTRTSQQCNL